MGMFDYIKCEVPLPDGWVGEMQTKDIDVMWMVTHIVTKEGRLLIDRGHNELVPLMERHMWKKEWGDTEQAIKEHTLEAMVGSLKWISNYQDANFHGILNFYGSEILGYKPGVEGYGERGQPIYKSHEYNAKFTNGQLDEILIVPEVDTI